MNTITDVDGNVYGTFKARAQLWLSSNLRTSRFTDGSMIPYVDGGYEWQHADQPAQCVYNNQAGNVSLGRLYNWHCIQSGQGLCPAGWRVANLQDWQVLLANLGGLPNALQHLFNGQEFNVQLAGARRGGFEGLGSSVGYWTPDSEPNQPPLPLPGRTSKAVTIANAPTPVMVSDEYQIEGFYVRCIKM